MLESIVNEALPEWSTVVNTTSVVSAKPEPNIFTVEPVMPSKGENESITIGLINST